MPVRGIFGYLAPLYVNKDCLLCHGYQGYNIGDVRGGISVSFDIDSVQRKLYSNTLQDSSNFAERLRDGLKKMVVETTSGSAAVSVTASLGVAELRTEDTTVDDIIKRVDEGLYRAKRTGRDRVCATED